MGKPMIALGRGAVPVPGTAMKRGIGTAIGGGGGGGARPMTAVSGAGFNSRQAASGMESTNVVVTIEP